MGETDWIGAIRTFMIGFPFGLGWLLTFVFTGFQSSADCSPTRFVGGFFTCLEGEEDDDDVEDAPMLIR